jgi:hypothetical protein
MTMALRKCWIRAVLTWTANGTPSIREQYTSGIYPVSVGTYSYTPSTSLEFARLQVLVYALLHNSQCAPR